MGETTGALDKLNKAVAESVSVVHQHVDAIRGSQRSKTPPGVHNAMP